MKCDFYMPVRLISGVGCIRNNAKFFSIGKKCMIVTGKNSAVASGALTDVKAVLEQSGIEYTIFDEITENPLLSACQKGGFAAAEFGAEYIIGIGGGSPLDASKAIAAFAANSTIDPMEIYDVEKLNPSLPIIAVPTTAGTGSETNPYAVLSLDGKNKKKTFTSPNSYAKYAFLDPSYTYSLGNYYTISCALDSFCHCVESLMSPKSTEISRMFALNGAAELWEELVKETQPDETAREALMYASMAGGVAINTTGTGFPHPLGYNLTMYKDIPHGRACAAFMREYLTYCRKSSFGVELSDLLAERLDCSIEDIMTLIPHLADVDVKLTDEEIELYIATTKDASNFKNCCYVINEDDMRDIYKRLFQ